MMELHEGLQIDRLVIAFTFCSNHLHTEDASGIFSLGKSTEVRDNVYIEIGISKNQEFLLRSFLNFDFFHN